MPDGSEEDEQQDERRGGRSSRTNSPTAARGGDRRSESQIESFGSSAQVRPGKFSTTDVPDASAIKTYWVHTREDWPGFVWQLINLLALSHAFVLINASHEAQANHTEEKVATTVHQEQLWMDRYGADRERLETVVYNLIKTCMSNFTELNFTLSAISLYLPQNCSHLWNWLRIRLALTSICARPIVKSRKTF